MDERAAIELYDKAGASGTRGPGRFPAVRWPDLALNERNLVRLAEGALVERIDLAREAFGPEFDSAAHADHLDEAWRTDDVQVRFAPEGVYLRVRFTVRVGLADDEGGEEASEELGLEGELCLSYSTRRHNRPFIDFMGGRIVRASDGAARVLDPFSRFVEPGDAVGWGLNGLE